MTRENHSRTVATLALLLTLALCEIVGAPPCAALESLKPDHPSYLAVKTIYDRVARAFGDDRSPPPLVLEPKPARTIAYYRGGNEEQVMLQAVAPAGSGRLRESSIVFGEGLLDELAPLGARRDSALALLIGHELSHFYRRHKVMNEFGHAFVAARTSAADFGKRPAAPPPTGADQEKVEGEADYFGGFYSYLAGYDTFAVAPQLYQTVYRAYQLDEKMSGYPGLESRIRIARGAEANLHRMVQVFESANRLLILGYHLEAARLYQYISRDFPSCEIFNNAGVAFALEALDQMPAAERRFRYPFEIDTQSRLAVRGKEEERGTPSWKSLLRLAGDCFDQALHKNERYAVAYVNRAAVYQLAGKPAMALGFVTEGLNLAADPATRADALTVRGILATAGDRREEAAADFREASGLGSQLAQMNQALLSDPLHPAAPPSRELKPAGRESIAGISLAQQKAVERPDFSLTLERSASEGELRIKGKQLDGGYRVSFDKTDLEFNDAGHFDLVATGSGYAGRTARGIGIGSPVAELKEKYGEPTRVVSARQGSYLVYERARILFVLDQGGGKVSGWMIYANGDEQD